MSCHSGGPFVVTVAPSDLSADFGAQVRLVVGPTVELQAPASASELPDVFSSELSTEKIHSGLPGKDLTRILSPHEWVGFAPVLSDSRLTRDGVVRVLASTLSVSHVWYANAALLARLGLEPARSYDDLRRQVPLLRSKGLDVVVMGNGEAGTLSRCLFSALLGRWGGPRMAADLASGSTPFTDPRFISALKTVQTLFADGVLSRRSLSTPYADVPALFATGRAPYCIDGDWRVPAWETDPNTGVALLSPIEQVTIILGSFPALPGEDPTSPRTSIELGPGHGLSSNLSAGSDREAAATRVLLALESPSVQRLRWQSGQFPSRIDALPASAEPLSRSRVSLYSQVTGSMVLDSLVDDAVRRELNQGLRDLAWATATPEAVAQRVQRAWEGARSVSDLGAPF